VRPPIIPVSGYGGWKYLQATYDRQLARHADAPDVKADRAYVESRLAQPLALKDFLQDGRLMRVAMTAFDLKGEEWKRGFVRKVLTEAATPGSTFLARLNNPKYTAFASAFAPRGETIRLTPEAATAVGQKFERATFTLAVGEVNPSMRLALNYQAEIGAVIGTGSAETAILYRMLGNVPVRTVLESALGLPESVRGLPVEKQAALFREKLGSVIGVTALDDLASPEYSEKIIRRFHAVQAAGNGGAGLGSLASQNLFQSRSLF
jgi:Protein of unknown function (DUF1217)